MNEDEQRTIRGGSDFPTEEEALEAAGLRE